MSAKNKAMMASFYRSRLTDRVCDMRALSRLLSLLDEGREIRIAILMTLLL